MRYLEDKEPIEKESIWLRIIESVVDWWDCDYDSPIRHLKRIIIGAGGVGLIGLFIVMMFEYPMVLGVIVICVIAYLLGFLLEN